MLERSSRPQMLAAATFVIEALGLADDAAAIADDLVLVEETAAATTLAVELDTADGPVAFLVYIVDLEWRDETGATGRDLVRDGLATLKEAERLDAPGPRAVASGEVGGWGMLLATTPMLYERLVGNRGARESDQGEPSPSTGARETGEAAVIANALLASLRETNRLAEAYLLATSGLGPGDDLRETELALFMADGRSLTPLLTVIRRVVEGSGPEG